MSSEVRIAQRVDGLLKKMTLREKISLLSGQDTWNTVAIDRLGIPAITMTDGPHGVRSTTPEAGRKMGPVTVFPTGISMGACWNPDLVLKVGQALGEETRGMGCDILLGPCVNIVREPRGGRNFETFSEDPYLSGRIAAAYIRGVQSRGVGTSLKHFAVNNFEVERNRASTRVDERTLREIYLSQFETAVQEGKPWTVMCSYNRINGEYASQNEHLLNEILRDEWGFDGVVVSDWGANHTVFESVAHGLDLEMPGPAKYFSLLEEAVQTWQIDEDAVDRAARRVLRMVLRSGRMEKKTSTGSVNTAEHQKLARQLAEEAITLLKNEGGILPIGKDVKSIAIVGPNAAEAVIEGGGSSKAPPVYRVSPLEGLQKQLGDKVKLTYSAGSDNLDEPFTVPTAWIKGGLHGEFFEADDFSGEPLEAQDGFGPDFWWHIAQTPKQIKPMSIRWTGTLTVPEDGDYQFKVNHVGRIGLFIDGTSVLANASSKPPVRDNFASRQVVKKLKAGKAYALRIDFVRYPEQELASYSLGLNKVTKTGKDIRLARAVDAARKSDLALIFAGYPDAYESEGRDRFSIDLMGNQNELIEAVAKVNPRTVVVLNTGAPVSMPWIEHVAAVVEAFYPGMENGNAIASVLTGSVNPSGKLPETFPRRLEDNPAYANMSYPGCREVNYGEGIFVGYRYYDEKGVAPLFPFGHGLSYTSFKYSELKVPKKINAGENAEVSVKVENTGKLRGKEVVQLYIRDVESSLPRPLRELKGFAKVDLRPGETKMVTFTLDKRSLAFYDPSKKAWVAEAGEFEVQVGSSSRDIRLRKIFTFV